MTIVVPAGNKNVEWVHEDQTLQKTASTGEIAQESVNPLYEAAKKYLQAKKDKEEKKDCDKCKKVPCECKATKEAGIEDLNKGKEDKPEDKPEDKKDDKPADKPADAPKSDSAVANVEQAVKEVVQKANEAEAVIEKVEVAVEKIEQAVQEVKTVVQKEVPGVAPDMGSDMGEKDEIEIEVSDEEPSIELDVQKQDGDKGLIVESEPDVEGCMAKNKVGMDKAAASEEFCRYSMISPDNKKKLYDYWVNALGFPKDYVKLLVKDYEA